MRIFLPAGLMVIAVSLGLAACGGGGGGGGGGVTPPDTTAPLATVAPTHQSLIDDDTVITITFNESMNAGVGAWQVTSVPAGVSDGGSWRTTTVQNDTLTISPIGGPWPTGNGLTFTIQARDLAGNPAATINLSYNVFYRGTIYYVDGARPNDLGDGLSPATARQYIHSAVADATPPATILIKAGNYPVNSGLGTQVVLKNQVSLYGGFNANFSERDPSTNVSRIEDQSTVAATYEAPNRAIGGNGAISNDTIIDGFTIMGSSQPGSGYNAAVVLFNGASPTLRNNRIHGGAGSTPFGIYNFSASPTVQGNTIDGGTGVDNSYGIYNVFSLALIQGNAIYGGNEGTNSYGMFNTGTNGSSPTVHNNAIHGGGAQRSHGLIDYNASSRVRNNTIYGGSGTLWSIGIVVEGNTLAASPSIDNNIVFTRPGAASSCVVESVPLGTSSANPASLRNNNLFNCTVLYRDFNAGCTGNGDGDGDPTTCNLAEMNVLTDITPVGGNVSLDPQFADVDGVDDNINTMADNDWRFSAGSPAGVKAGGLNGLDQIPLWPYTTDKNGVARPAFPSPWSMGAYEPN